MAKFCANCGSRINDKDKVCGQCGSPIISPPFKTTPAPHPRNNRTIIIISIIAIILILFSLNIFSGSTGYKRTINKMVKAIQNNNAASLEPMASSIDKAWLQDELKDYYSSCISDIVDKYESDIGKIRKISYKIINTTMLPEEEFEEAKSFYVFGSSDVNNIKGGAEIDVELTVKGAQGTSTYILEDILLTKEKGRWKLSVLSLSDDFE